MHAGQKEQYSPWNALPESFLKLTTSTKLQCKTTCLVDSVDQRAFGKIVPHAKIYT